MLVKSTKMNLIGLKIRIKFEQKGSIFMAFDINQVVIDRVKRVSGRNRETGELYFLTGQVADPSLQCDAQEVIKTDAEDVAVARWMNGKSAKFSGSETFLNFDLMSHQLNGEDKTVADETHPINVPSIEEVKVGAEGLTEYTLKHAAVNFGTTDAPNYKITVCTLRKDGSRDKKFTIGQAASETVCTYTAGTKKLTFADGALKEGDKLFIQYDYSSTECVAVYDYGDKFPTDMEIVVEVMAHPLCSSSTAYAGFLVFPNATLSSSVTYNFGKTESFPFEFSAQQDYCDENKQLFRMVFPENAE